MSFIKNILKRSVQITVVLVAFILVVGGISDYVENKRSPEEIAAEISKLETEAASIPQGDFNKNINIYRKLELLDLDNKTYREKLRFYEGKKEEFEKSEGYDCFSNYNSRHFNLLKIVQEGTRNPDSFEFVSGKVYKSDQDGNRYVDMTYRGENGFGGTSVETVRGLVRNSDCAVLGVEQIN